MNFQKVFWGIGLLLLGCFMLFEHLGLFHIHWWYLIHFWPVIIIIWGVSILPIKNNLKTVISIAIVILTVILVAFVSDRPDYFKHLPGIYFHHNNDNEEEWDPPYYDADSSTTNI